MKIPTLFRTAVLLTAIIGTILTATAHDFEVDGIYYYKNSDGSVSVTYKTNTSGCYSGTVTIPSRVSYNNTSYLVTSIGMNAFYDCSGLTSITIPNSVTSIGKNAFYNCSGLTSFTIPNSVVSIDNYAFDGCSGLTSFTIPNSVASIGDYAFRNCRGLASVTIGTSVTSIGKFAFQGCSALTKLNYNAISCSGFNYYYLPFYYLNISTIVIGNSVKSIPAYFAYNLKRITNITIPNSVTSIGGSAFSGCTGLASITIPNSVTSIGGYAFSDCTGLASITIPNSIASIGESTFSGCTGLTSFTIPNTVTSIGESAFKNCSGLTSATIGTSVTSIGNYAFQGCTALTKLNFNAISCSDINSSNVDSHPFYNLSISTLVIGNSVKAIPANFAHNLKYLTSIIIPNSVTSIGNSAFSGCSGLTSATIGTSVTSIGINAFYGCDALTKLTFNAISCADFYIDSYNKRYPPFYGLNISTIIVGNTVKRIPAYFAYQLVQLSSVTIGSSVNTIGDNSFYNCSKLSSVTIPNSVTSIGNYAFQNCLGMTRITFGNVVESIGYQAFNGCTKLTSVNIPNSVISIGESAFSGCSSLTSATIGNSISTIQSYTFSNCTSLSRVVIGNSVNSFQEGVFYGCRNMTKVYCRANMPPKYEPYHSSFPLFEDVAYQNAILYVPDITYDYYCQADPWKNFMEIKTESYSADGVSFMSSIYPTSIKMEAVNGPGTQQASSYFTFEGSKYNTLLVTGLEPTSIYSGTYYSKTADGTIETPFKFFTSELTMVPEGAKMLTETTALLKAETNMADEETICGFDWRLYEGPDDYLGTRVYCPVYDGTMAGTLKGLKKDTFYKYRPFYKSNANNVYYGDWVTFYTGDVGVEFAPVVYTYDSPAVTQNAATLQGVALRGSDEITEQGFEYWKRNGSVTKVTAEGERMSKTVTGLTAGTTYTFRAYLKSGGKTTYGREIDFVTVSGGMDVNADGAVNIADVNLIINYILSGKYGNLGDVNGDGTINITDVNLIINEILSH